MKALLIVAIAAMSIATPVAAMSCNRSIPHPDHSKHCTATDIDQGRRGCTAADCEIDINGCEVDWAPLCSGLDLALHNIFGWPIGSLPPDELGRAIQPTTK